MPWKIKAFTFSCLPFKSQYHGDTESGTLLCGVHNRDIMQCSEPVIGMLCTPHNSAAESRDTSPLSSYSVTWSDKTQRRRSFSASGLPFGYPFGAYGPPVLILDDSNLKRNKKKNIVTWEERDDFNLSYPIRIWRPHIHYSSIICTRPHGTYLVPKEDGPRLLGTG